MKLVTCIIGFIICTCINGKKIKIQIDTDDIVKLMTGFMNSDTLNKFTNQLVRRSAAQYGGYSNPYHPEDELVNKIDEAMDQQKKYIENKPQINNDKDPLDKENDNFISDSEITSPDLLTDNESSKTNITKYNITEPYKPEERGDITKKATNLLEKVYETAEFISSKNYNLIEDKANFKPLQKRFLLKSSDGN